MQAIQVCGERVRNEVVLNGVNLPTLVQHNITCVVGDHCLQCPMRFPLCVEQGCQPREMASRDAEMCVGNVELSTDLRFILTDSGWTFPSSDGCCSSAATRANSRARQTGDFAGRDDTRLHVALLTITAHS